MTKEIFKDIPGYENLYQVSNLGNVKSLERNVRHWRGGFKTIKERILKTAPTTMGYLSVVLSRNNKNKTFNIHQLVAFAFLNHISKGHKLVVNHKDFDKTNNKLDNLEIITQRENANKKHLKSSSQYIGAHWHKNSEKWESKIHINGKQKRLGSFANEYDAHLAYKKALNEINKAY